MPHLVMMANQIARNLAAQGETVAVAAMTDHIRDFWDPRMKALIADHLAKGGDGLDPMAVKALQAVSDGRS
jgi:formate dehydrogenase subunit delta